MLLVLMTFFNTMLVLISFHKRFPESIPAKITEPNLKLLFPLCLQNFSADSDKYPSVTNIETIPYKMQFHIFPEQYSLLSLLPTGTDTASLHMYTSENPETLSYLKLYSYIFLLLPKIRCTFCNSSLLFYYPVLLLPSDN